MHCTPCTPEITFRVVENRYLQCVESIFVNLPQFAKSGLKESLNRFFWYFSLQLFGYFGLVSSRPSTKAGSDRTPDRIGSV